MCEIESIDQSEKVFYFSFIHLVIPEIKMRSSIVYLLVASLALCHGAPNTFQTIRSRAHYAFRNYPVKAQTEEKRGN